LQDGSGNNNNPELIPVIENVRKFNKNPFHSADVSDLEFNVTFVKKSMRNQWKKQSKNYR
jgi:hypothetical protein